jgi:hypothetical protein
MRIRLWGIVALGASLLFCPFSPGPAEAGGPTAKPRLGMNLSAPEDYGTELPFVDVFHTARPWISQRKGAGWGKGPALAMDEHGWVTRLEPGCWAETLLCTIRADAAGGHYPGGVYTVLYDGTGKLDFGGAAAVLSSSPGRMSIRVTPSKGEMFLRVRATDPANHLRNIRVIMPGFENTYRENPWHPKFLERWQGMACLRFMDFMRTNSSPISSWSERPHPNDASFMAKGVPAELLIDLANRLKVDPWFCMPHRADDDYVRKFAELVKERLDLGLRAYVEYSNEVWNSGFRQHAYAAAEGQKLGFAKKSWEAAWHYTSYRSVQIFKIWEEVFGGTSRLVRVLASQAAAGYISEQIVSFHDAYKHADVLAIAPYLTFNLGPKTKPSASEVAGWTVEQVLDHIEKQSVPEALKWIARSKGVAGKYKLKLVAYEGGQHMVGVFGGQDNPNLTKLFLAANADPRLGKIYDHYLDGWKKAGGGLFCHFNSVGLWGKFGSWGLLQHYDEDPAHSPKFMAVMRWARACGQKVNLPE